MDPAWVILERYHGEVDIRSNSLQMNNLSDGERHSRRLGDLYKGEEEYNAFQKFAVAGKFHAKVCVCVSEGYPMLWASLGRDRRHVGICLVHSGLS